MTAPHEYTPEERAFERLYEEARGTLSAEACAVLAQANYAAYADNMVTGLCVGEGDSEEAERMISLAAPNFTRRDREALQELARRALSAAASVDPFDRVTPVSYRAYRSDLHQYYRQLSDRIGEVLLRLIYNEEEARWTARRWLSREEHTGPSF